MLWPVSARGRSLTEPTLWPVLTEPRNHFRRGRETHAKAPWRAQAEPHAVAGLLTEPRN